MRARLLRLSQVTDRYWSSPSLLQSVRLLSGVVGGYVVSALIVESLSVLLTRITALSASDSVILASMTGFLVYLVLILGSFAKLRLYQLLAILMVIGGSAWGVLQVLQGASSSGV
jgi:hypothetical protein